jgi:hypothetical protein
VLNAALRLSQLFQEPLSIPVILENRAPFVAAHGDLINRPGELNSEQLRHVSDSRAKAPNLSTGCSTSRNPLTGSA